ncbi:MAG: filamentous hemagglutinin N-terminal domain-containing protein [Okeania sp. SIO2C9]|uniref:two-partner secretion domain-containing protein n=1 Tax=Okeania sp. SIO2C9 TaxID=2607791 RepID=UPI0013BEE66C|nr:ShlB/FhaC/HecB family hemolysin secretion/activation protein [Okeania sp. SIO2C9]NEQ77773.1 filamentous hemagglutinin N-terminal domain-containing protein [Okeania sp. SIO2C9]
MSHLPNFSVSTILSLTYLTLGCWEFLIPPAFAQLQPDSTLGEESSVVTPNININGIESDRVEGGAQRGANLFHSFEEFNIQQGRGVYFSNPDGVTNIFGRVTGNNVSNILGTLGVLGNANLFLLNPNGIIFGPEAQLDIGGSFYGATADSVLFENGFEFATSDPQAPPLLTVNVPIGLRLPENAGSIQVAGQGHNLSTDPNTQAIIRENRNIGLQVQPNQTLALIGGDISLRGGNLTAENGRIEVGSVQNGVVGITSVGSLNYGEISTFGNLQLSQASSLDVSGENTGEVVIQGGRIEMRDGSIIVAETLGTEDGGNLIIRASDSIEVVGTTGESQIFSGMVTQVAPEAVAQGSNLRVETKSLQLREGAQFTTLSFGQGNTGNLTISATDLELIGASVDGASSGLFAVVFPGGVGNGGDIDIDTERLRVIDGAQILTGSFGEGNGGNLTVSATDVEVIGTSPLGQASILFASVLPGGIGNGGALKIDTENLRLRDGGQITTSTFGEGNGGNLTVSATDLEIIGTDADSQMVSGLFASVQLGGVGNGGSIDLDTENLTVGDGGQINTVTFGEGNGGNLIISATNIELIGTSADGQFSSGLLASLEPEAIGNGGNIEIETENLTIRDGAGIVANTFGEGNGGNIAIYATDIEIIGTTADGLFPSGLFAIVEPGGMGNGGTITLNTESLTILDGAQIVTATFGEGDGGNLTVSTTNVELIGTTADGVFPTGLFTSVDVIRDENGQRTEQQGIGNGGNLRLNTENLIVRDGAQISAATLGQGNGGDLTISATNVELIGTNADDLRISGLTTSVQEEEARGNGGNLRLNTRNLRVRDGAEITASTSGDGNAGNLIITAKDVEVFGISAAGTPSRLTAAAESTATGQGGTLIVNTESLEVQNGALVTVRSETSEPAGNLQIKATSILLDNQGSLNAETTGGQGDIVLENDKDLILRRNSSITTNATGTATGGNITINTDNLVALENSDISANAQEAFGGRINITALGIFGSEFRLDQTEDSDITATSELGPSFSGEVNLNTPDVDPSDGLVEFDDTIEDISALIDQNPCQRGQGSEFTITGKGGLPPNPSESFPPNTLWQEKETPNTSPEIITPSDQEFVEAQGWVSTPNGIQLILNPKTATPARPWLIPPNCKQLDSQQPKPYLVASTMDIIPSPNSQSLEVTIQQFNFEGNTKFSNEELQQQLTPYLGQPITFAELIAARTAITQYYTKNNYITSGAFIPPQTISENGTVTLKVVEGKVDEINVNINGRLNESYIKSRLQGATSAPLNQEKLLSALQLLQLDPLVKTISAELSAGVRPDTSILDVEVVTANPWQIAAISNNGRAPSVGSFRRGVEVGYGNLTGMGDRVNTLYTNTDGSDTVEVSYSIPVNSSNGRVELFYRHQDNEVIESPFERLDINSNSNTYKLAFRQPIVQTSRQRLSLGLGATRRDSQTSILGTNFPLSEGADDDGKTKLSIFQFFQDYQLRGDNQVLSLYSEFNLGVGILDATVNSNEPDSRFFYWRGQGQWVSQLAEDTLLVVGADVQLSPSDLVPLERFGLGGYRSVRAYRQDARLTDNGALGTVELRLPLPWISGENRLFQIIPFIDGGVAWNSDGEEVPGTNALAAVGLGLQVNLWEKINMRLDYGIPLIDVDSRDLTAQEEGFYFSISSTLFSF